MSFHEMQAVEITGAGDASRLTLTRRPIPMPGSGEVLIEIEAAGVNYPDILQRKGLYPLPPGASDLPGLEVSGRIAALGPDVTGWRLGDPVCALVPGGGYAGYCIAPVGSCLPIPAGLNFAEAASLPEVFFTVWFNLVQQGGLRAGMHLLVHGGSGGIGSAAIQVAKALGATVYATAGSEAKCAYCLELGAGASINYRTQDFGQEVQALTEGRGVDMVLDFLGGDMVQRNLDALAPGGRLINLYFLQGPRSEIDLSVVLKKNLILTGALLRPQPNPVKAHIAEGLRRDIWPKFDAKHLKPNVFRVFPLAEAAAAHRLMESRNHCGKIVLSLAR